MSELVRLAEKRIKDLDESIRYRNEFVAEHEAELAAAREDLAHYQAQRDELIAFLATQEQDK